MFNVKFADIGEGIHEGVVYKMNAVVGEKIEEGDTLFLVETDKVTAEIPSPVSGTIFTVNAEEGDEINVGNTIIVIDDGSSKVNTNMQTDDDHSDIKEKETGASVVGDIEVSSDVIASSTEGHVIVEKIVQKHILATPVARKLAKELGIDINIVVGSGPAGRIMKADIYEEDEKNKIPVKPKIDTKETHKVIEDIIYEPMSMIRKTIAEHIVKSKFTIPHAVVMDEVDVTELVKFREEVKNAMSEDGVKLTYMPLIIKAITISLKKHGIVNSSLDEENNMILLKQYVNIGIAVDTPRGLMVPVIKRCDHKSIVEIAGEIEDLSERASTKQLKLEELRGSTFTITNYGAFGSSFGVPVINYPDAAVLGVGLITKKPVVVNDEIAIRSMMPLSMSFDHRIIDGADAGRFMTTLKKLLSTPHLLLLS